MGRKLGEGARAAFLGRGSWVLSKHNVAWTEAHLHAKCYVDPSSHSGTTDMSWKLGALPPFWGGGAGSPSNTMWPGQRHNRVPSFILIHSTVWDNTPTSQTGQTIRQRSNSIGWTVLQTVAQKLSKLQCPRKIFSCRVFLVMLGSETLQVTPLRRTLASSP